MESAARRFQSPGSCAWTIAGSIVCIDLRTSDISKLFAARLLPPAFDRRDDALGYVMANSNADELIVFSSTRRDGSTFFACTGKRLAVNSHCALRSGGGLPSIVFPWRSKLYSNVLSRLPTFVLQTEKFSRRRSLGMGWVLLVVHLKWRRVPKSAHFSCYSIRLGGSEVRRQIACSRMSSIRSKCHFIVVPPLIWIQLHLVAAIFPL